MIKSEHQVTIHQPIEKVMELFKNQDYFKEWQRGLISFKNLTPHVGEVGCKRSMKIRVAGTSITMIEEITEVNLPHIWEATYKTKGVINRQSNRFKEVELLINGEMIKATVWDSSATFTFTGMMRLIARGRPQLFTAQTNQHMEDFKTFATSM